MSDDEAKRGYWGDRGRRGGPSRGPTAAVGLRRRVLIVDDDPDFLEIAEMSLLAYGFDVARASGGLRGVFLATQEVPDAILCDLRMPGIDGFVVAEALRADPATQHTAIFACTGRRDLEARALGRSSSFDAVLIKPVDWEEVARCLGRAIDSRRSQAGF
jgi:CheY-like chemotaxis protein